MKIISAHGYSEEHPQLLINGRPIYELTKDELIVAFIELWRWSNRQRSMKEYQHNNIDELLSP